MVRVPFPTKATGMAVLALAVSAVLFAACSKGEAPQPAIKEGRTTPASVKDWTSSEIKANPVEFAEAAIRATDANIKKLRQLETVTETSRQAAERKLAALDDAVEESRRFGRAAKPLCDAPDTIYPVTISGRSFPSHRALQGELLAAMRLIKTAPTNRVILVNQVARDAATLSDIQKQLREYARRKYELERKADAARSAVAERDLRAIQSIADELADVAEAGLPSDELFAPPVHRLGDDGGASELKEFEF